MTTDVGTSIFDIRLIAVLEPGLLDTTAEAATYTYRNMGVRVLKMAKSKALDYICDTFVSYNAGLTATTVRDHLDNAYAQVCDAITARRAALLPTEPLHDMDGSYFQSEPTAEEEAAALAENERQAALTQAEWEAEMKAEADELADQTYHLQHPEEKEITGNNAIDYDLTTVAGILHALKNGRYLGGPAVTSAQRKNLRSKLRRLGYKLSDTKSTPTTRALAALDEVDADEEAYQEKKAASEYEFDR